MTDLWSKQRPNCDRGQGPSFWVNSIFYGRLISTISRSLYAFIYFIAFCADCSATSEYDCILCSPWWMPAIVGRNERGSQFSILAAAGLDTVFHQISEWPLWWFYRARGLPTLGVWFILSWWPARSTVHVTDGIRRDTNMRSLCMPWQRTIWDSWVVFQLFNVGLFEGTIKNETRYSGDRFNDFGVNGNGCSGFLDSASPISARVNSVSQNPGSLILVEWILNQFIQHILFPQNGVYVFACVWYAVACC